MKKLILSFIVAALPFSMANAEDQAGQWQQIVDGQTIEKFLISDKAWADALVQAMGTSGSGGVTGLQNFTLGGSGSGGVTGTVLHGIYEIKNFDDFKFFSNFIGIEIRPPVHSFATGPIVDPQSKFFVHSLLLFHACDDHTAHEDTLCKEEDKEW